MPRPPLTYTDVTLTDDQVRRSYHSGLTTKAIDVESLVDSAKQGFEDRHIYFATAKYCPPKFRVTLRSDVLDDWTTDLEGEFHDGVWTFTLPVSKFPGDFWMKLVLNPSDDSAGFWMEGGDEEVRWFESYRYFSDAKILFAYNLKFSTEAWLPSHLLTLRNNIDGWGRDIFGVFSETATGGTWNFLLDRHAYPDEFDAKLVLDRSLFMEGENNLSISSGRQYYEWNDDDVRFPVLPSAYVHGYDNFTSIEGRIEQLTVRSFAREDDHYDVIVIGSGMGGGTLADDLSDRGAKVLVLEAGGMRLPVHMNELPRSESGFVGRDQLSHFRNREHSKFHAGVHFNLGGRSVYWSGLIPRMQPWEFRDDWPIEVRDYLLAPEEGNGYAKAEILMRKRKTLGPYQDDVVELLNDALGPNFKASDLPRSLHQPNLDENAVLKNVIERSTGGFSTADLLLDSLGFADPAGRNNLSVNLHHFVKRIETGGNRATCVVCEDLIGKVERRFQGSYVVLACGSLESAKLALNSNLNDPRDMIGRGLTDHPAYFYDRLHPLPTSGDLGWLGDPLGHAKVMLRHKHATAEQHAYNIELLINAKYWDTRHADDDLWNRRLNTGETAKVEMKFIFDSPLDDGNRIYSNGDGKKLDVFVKPNMRAEVYKLEMVQVRNQILAALGIDAPCDDWNPDEWRLGVEGSVHHAGGSLRMSDNGTGVVDQYLKFEEYDNLYCCDVSVYPSIPAANPSLTLVALAQRLAGTLYDRIENGD